MDTYIYASGAWKGTGLFSLQWIILYDGTLLGHFAGSTSISAENSDLKATLEDHFRLDSGQVFGHTGAPKAVIHARAAGTACCNVVYGAAHVPHVSYVRLRDPSSVIVPKAG